MQTLTSAERLDNPVSVLEIRNRDHGSSLWVKKLRRFVFLQHITIGLEVSLDNLAEPLDALLVGRFDVPGVEESVDEETLGGALDVFVGQTGDWHFGFRRRFMLTPRLFHLVLCRAHVLFSEGEDLLDELRRQIQQSWHGGFVLRSVMFGFRKVVESTLCWY
jgi:hypothetical protein